MNQFLAGALGGLIATVPMTMAMTKLWKQLPMKYKYPLPPREITEVTAMKVSPDAQKLSDQHMMELSLAAHFAYGGVTGALYPLLYRKRRNPLIWGANYGLGIWAASYLGWVPAAKILQPATQHPAARNRMMIVSHLIWGATTVLIGERLRRTSRTINKAREEDL